MRPQRSDACSICGKQIEDRRRYKYCSTECAQIGRRMYVKQWLADNADYMATYFQANKDKYSRTERRKRHEIAQQA